MFTSFYTLSSSSVHTRTLTWTHASSTAIHTHQLRFLHSVSRVPTGTSPHVKCVSALAVPHLPSFPGSQQFKPLMGALWGAWRPLWASLGVTQGSARGQAAAGRGALGQGCAYASTFPCTCFVNVRGCTAETGWNLVKGAQPVQTTLIFHFLDLFEAN